MRDGLRDFPKAFPEEDVDVVRIVHGLPGSSLGRLDSRETLKVTWCRETTSRIELLVNGHQVHEHGTFCDTSKLGQSLGHALEDWKEYVDRYDAGPGDKVEVRVVSWLEDVPTFGRADVEGYGRTYYHTLTDKVGPFFLGVPEKGLDSMDREDLRTLRTRFHSKTEVASSLWSAEQVEKAVADFRFRAEEEVRTETDPFDYVI